MGGTGAKRSARHTTEYSQSPPDQAMPLPPQASTGMARWGSAVQCAHPIAPRLSVSLLCILDEVIPRSERPVERRMARADRAHTPRAQAICHCERAPWALGHPHAFPCDGPAPARRATAQCPHSQVIEGDGLVCPGAPGPRWSAAVPVEEGPHPCLVWLKISTVSTPLKLLRLGVYWIARSRHDLQPEERL